MTASKSELITERFISNVCQRLRDGKFVRRSLPDGGRLHIDRQLPFLVAYRRHAETADPDTERLVRGEAAHLLARGGRSHHANLSALVKGVVSTLTQSFGSFLIIEVWALPAAAEESERERPSFRVVTSQPGLASTSEELAAALQQVKIKGKLARVGIITKGKVAPPRTSPLLAASDLEELGCYAIGIEVNPVYRDAANGTTFPLVGRVLHRGFSRALKRAVYEFTRKKTTHSPPHYQALGRRSMVKAVWDVDRELAEVSNSFDLLLQITPVDVERAWRQFRRGGFETAPTFSTRRLPVEPALLKRRLFQIPIERIEDPTLAHLFREQQTAIDRKLSMLGDRGTPSFLYGSLQLFGNVDDSLLNSAYEILNRVPSRSRDESRRGSIDAHAFAKRAEEELDHYRALYPAMQSRVEVRSDVTGLLVSRGNLLVGQDSRVPPSRVDALLQHEVGTHVLTYYNGRAQPFRQLYVGLAGYDELQEGLAVLAEYLVGGLSRPRLRLLAARVVAVKRMIEGTSFPEVFRELDRAYEFSQRTAFTIAMRVFRGGGFTKDAAYLRGLVHLLAYLRGGGDLDPLWIGKIGAAHIPIVEELSWRNVLIPPPLRPRYLDRPEVKERMMMLRNGLTPLQLIQRRKT